MTIDTTQLAGLRLELQRSDSDVANKVERVVKRGAMNIKRDWQSNAAARGSRHARRYPSSITFDMKGKLEAEIGPVTGLGQGFLGYILEYGGAHSPPFADGKRAVDKELPRFDKELAKVFDRFLV